ncbi:hypothetical protein HAX54_023521, partial [Datura stramonium]|nr:hypothetical protein [Datura stramonium]
MGFDSLLKILSDEEIYHSRPPPCRMLTVREIYPSWKPDGVDTTSYHELRTLELSKEYDGKDKSDHKKALE